MFAKLRLSFFVYSAVRSRCLCLFSTRAGVSKSKKQLTMKVIHVPALSDNYMYLIIDTTSNVCAAVDPVEPNKLLQKVKEENLHLTAVLTTHHHWDHAGGNKELASLVPGISVYGGDDRIDCLTNKIGHDDQFKIGTLKIRCLFTPCHTSGHICYFITSNDSRESPIVFTGDTLFIGGCGRFFEGTAEQMYTALVRVLGSLPRDSRVYCGHEYTLQNLLFASQVEPANKMVKEKLLWAQERKESGQVTIPSTIEEEFQTNPFMRVHEASVQSYARASDPILTMKMVRQKKDSFKG